jgi:membrane protease YdiL (CAAX protease family)
MNKKTEEQYSLAKVLGIWALVAIPMPILAFVVAPALAPHVSISSLLLVWYLLIAGMMWQFVVSVIILYRELDEFTWSAIKKRIWLQKPIDPKTGKSSYRLFWWLIPAFLFYAVFELTPLAEAFTSFTVWAFPFIKGLPPLDLAELMTLEYVGAWWLVVVALISNMFNYFLGEELLFRGILLPKMKGVFGKWDWFANSVLFGTYHLHRPFFILTTIFSSIAYSWPSRRFKSMWFGVILHGIEGLFVLAGVFALVMGWEYNIAV